MDATALPTSSKWQKLLGEWDASQNKDFISKLPYDILVRILSCLSTEEAIKTSILSKRWKYLWLSLPNLSFMDPSFSWSSKNPSDDQILELWETFFGSIDRAIILRNASCLRNLRLWFNMQVDASRLQSWLSAAIKHNVQKLSLSFPGIRKFELPNSLFTSKSLSSFWLSMHCPLEVPNFICFPSLKFLSLGDIFFQDDQSAQRLFSVCPVLEELEFSNCNWKNITGITIENPTLRFFTFSDTDFPDYFFNSKVRISAINLDTLCVTGGLTVELLLCNVPSLNSASIDGLVTIERVLKLLSGLESVKSLDVSNEILESLSFAENLQEHLPTFYNLTYLKAYVDSPYDCDGRTSGTLMNILQKSPNLQCLEVPRVFKKRELNMIFESVPTCFRSSLKQFFIFKFRGNEEGILLLKYLYENAPVLKRIVIECSPTFSKDLEKQEEIRLQFQQLRGAAPGCLIMFFPYKFLQENPLAYEGFKCA